MRCLKLFLLFSISQKSADQSSVITTTGGSHPKGNEALNLSCGSNLSNISHISSILPKDVINTVIEDTDDPLIKSWKAKEKASALWKKIKQIKEQKAAEEKLKQQRLTEEEETRRKHEEEKKMATEQHEMRLRQQLKEKYMKDMEKEKERLEMQKTEEKYRSKLLFEVRKDMGLPMNAQQDLEMDTRNLT